MNSKVQALLNAGWFPASTQPHDTRRVQIAWDDGSTSPSTIGFCDEAWAHPRTGVRVWWATSACGYYQCPDVSAWREIPNSGDAARKE